MCRGEIDIIFHSVLMFFIWPFLTQTHFHLDVFLLCIMYTVSLGFENHFINLNAPVLNLESHQYPRDDQQELTNGILRILHRLVLGEQLLADGSEEAEHGDGREMLRSWLIESQQASGA